MGRFTDWLLMRETPPVGEGSEVSLEPQLSAWLSETFSTGLTFSPRLLERVWVAARCLQLNAQQVASMRLRFEGTWDPPPAWLSHPDPHWYPNGIGDALFSITWHMYGWGEAFLLVTDRYRSGFPSAWTVLLPELMDVRLENGRRAYRYDGRPLNRDDVVHIFRDNRGGLRGTSALAAYAVPAWNVIASGEMSNDVLNNLPPAVLKSMRKLTREQAEAVQDQWAARASTRRRGVPPVLPPELDLVATNLGFSPKDLLLLDSAQYDARVIASAFGVPASLLNMPIAGGLTYQNPAMLGEQWWRFELLPAAKRISDALTANMLPRGNAVIFDAAATFSPLDTQEEGIFESPAKDASPADRNGTLQGVPA
jgi:HK97 family phage portal protein